MKPNERSFHWRNQTLTYTPGSICDQLGVEFMRLIWDQGIATWNFLHPTGQHKWSQASWACRNCTPPTETALANSRPFDGTKESILNHFGELCEQEKMLKRLGS